MTHTLRVFWTSFLIGWENESNWIWRPAYFLYALMRPFAMCLILYFLFMAKGFSNAGYVPSGDPEFLAVYISNAFFTIFIAASSGVGWVIMEDREFYRIIKYIFIAPMRFSLYIIGRAMLVMCVSFVSTLIILLFGWLALDLPFGALEISWLTLFLSLVLGLISSGAIGMMLAGFMLVTARHATLLAEGIGGIFLLLCGVIFKLDFLPGFWQKIAMGIPMTYWMEATRRSFGLPPFGLAMQKYSDNSLLLFLFVFAVVYLSLSIVVFKLCTRLAKKYGKIDQVTHY